MRGKLITVAGLLTSLAGSINAAAIDWSWSFTPSTVFITPEMETPGASPVDFNSYFFVPYTVTNNAASTEDINTYFELSLLPSASFPMLSIYDAQGRRVLSPTIFVTGSIVPGQEATMNKALMFNANAYFFEDIAKGESFTIDPTLYAWYKTASGEYGKEAKNSLAPLVLTAAIPEPSTSGLLLLGLGLLAWAKNHRSASSQQLKNATQASLKA